MRLILSFWMLYLCNSSNNSLNMTTCEINRVNRARTCQSLNAVSCWRLTVCEVKSTCLRSQLSSASRLMLFPNLAYNWTFKSPRTSWMDDTRPSRALISSCRASCGDQNRSMEMLSATTRLQNKLGKQEKYPLTSDNSVKNVSSGSFFLLDGFALATCIQL